MRYFLISQLAIDNGPTCFHSFGDICPGGISWMLGRPLSFEIPTPIQYDVDRLPVNDFPCTNGSQLLMSDKLFALLSRSSSVLRAYASELLCNGRLVSSEYQTVNFEHAFPALDWDRSEYTEYKEHPDCVASVQRLVLDQSLVEQLPKGEHVFRLYESGDLIASEQFRDEVITSGIDGVDFFDFENQPMPY